MEFSRASSASDVMMDSLIRGLLLVSIGTVLLAASVAVIRAALNLFFG